MKCWKEHFCTHLNTQFPRDENVLQSIPDPPNTDAGSEPFTLRLEQRPHYPSFQEGRQTQSKQLQSNHPTLHTRESILQDDP